MQNIIKLNAAVYELPH